MPIASKMGNMIRVVGKPDINLATGGGGSSVGGAETTARMDADSTLQSNINLEVTARLDGDSTLQNNLNSEITSRLNGDSTLQSNLNSEITSRLNGDSTLQSNLNSEITARLNGDSTLQSNLNSEITSRLNGDSTLQSNLDSEITARLNGDSTLQANLDSETTSRLLADSTLTSNLNSEITSRLNGDSTLQANLNSEITSRLNADSTLQSNLDSETTSRLNGDSTLQANLNTETTARLNADSTLLTAIYANTTDILEELKEQLTDSVYSLVTPVVFKTDNTTFTGGGSANGAYSLADLSFLYSAGGGIFESTNLLDTNEFLNVSTSNIQDVTQVDLQVFWKSGKIDTAASYYVSRDGGANYSSLTMTQNGYGSGAYYATYKFIAESTYAALVTQSAGASNMVLDAANIQSYAQAFTLSAASTLKSQTLYVTVTGTPIGSLYVSWVNVAASLPSTAAADLLAISAAIDASALSTGTLSVAMPETPLPAGNYFLVVSTDSVYRDHYTSSGHSVGLTYDASINGASKYNGTVWSDDATNGIKHIVNGRALDLRVKIVSSTSGVALSGFGLFYAPSTTNIVSTNKKIQVFRFKSATENLSTFTLTSFLPDKDLLKVYWAEAGLCLIYPGFQLSGYSIVFPSNTFYDVTNVDVTLVAQQLEGSSLDNSDTNGALLTESHLGSTSATLDRSVAGRGIYLRNAAGVLREISLDASDNIIIMDT